MSASSIIREQLKRAPVLKRETKHDEPTGQAAPWPTVIAAVFGATVETEADEPTTPDSWAEYFKRQEQASE